MTNTPQLDLLYMDTHNSQTMAIGDASVYPVSGFTISTPTIEVTPPSFPTVSLSFVPRNIMVFNSDTLKISCTDSGGCLTTLPDGLYKVKYSVAPAYLYSVEKY